MADAEQLHLTPIAASIDNAADWPEIAKQVESEAGLETLVTPETLTAMLAGAVALLFRADAARDMSPLRGTFADGVIAQRQRNAGCLQAAQPVAVRAHLIGAHTDTGHPTLRMKLAVHLLDRDGQETVMQQFWDLQLGAQATVGRPTCPNCGAPVAPGQLICEYCQADLRNVTDVPLLVSRLELY
jgi:hypothetical protein